MLFKKWAWKSQSKAEATNERSETLISALIACSASLQSANILGVRMTVLICFCNPGSGYKSSSCQWQSDISWIQETTLKWKERQERKSTRVDRKSVFDNINVRDVDIYNFKWKVLKTNNFVSLNISCINAMIGNNDPRKVLIKQATQGKAMHCLSKVN